MSYRIVRFYQHRSTPSRVLRRNLTLEQARTHCQSRESSSRTCISAEGKKETQERGDWFDGIREDGKEDRPLNRRLMQEFRDTWSQAR